MSVVNQLCRYLSLLIWHPIVTVQKFLEYCAYIFSDASPDSVFQPPVMWIQRTADAYLKFHGVSVLDVQKIPDDGPVMFVMNHQTYAFEVPIFMSILYLRTGRWPRGLADHMHWYCPHKVILVYFGAILGTREVTSAHMRNKDDIIVYPGGANEVMRLRNAGKYILTWGERTGFAALAIEHGYTIVPVAGVGAEECVHIFFNLPIQWLVRLAGMTPRSQTHVGIGVFKPFTNERFYFKFGDLIDTRVYNGKATEANRQRVRDMAKQIVLADIDYCLAYRQDAGARSRYMIDFQIIET